MDRPTNQRRPRTPGAPRVPRAPRAPRAPRVPTVLAIVALAAGTVLAAAPANAVIARHSAADHAKAHLAHFFLPLPGRHHGSHRDGNLAVLLRVDHPQQLLDAVR